MSIVGMPPAQAANFDVASDSQLRNAISNAGSGDTITFKANITLVSNLPTVNTNLTINGSNFTLSGDNQFRGLFVQSGTMVINDLAITGAKAQGGDGGNGYVGAGGGGGGGLGGALFVATGANVTVSNVRLQSNLARGGDGGVSTGSSEFSSSSGGGGGYWPTGANGGDGSGDISGGGGTGGGGDGSKYSGGAHGGFGGGGGGGGLNGGAGGFGGGGGGTSSPFVSANHGGAGGFGGGTGGYLNAGGGAGFGGAVFVQDGGILTLTGGLGVSGNIVAPGSGWQETPARSAGAGIFLHGSGILTFAPGEGKTQTINDAIVDQTGAGATVAGAGSWSLVKDAPGTTILSGENAYTGGTTVNSGVLQGTTTSLQGNILNNARVVFDQSSNGAYVGGISGTGALTKAGAGIMALTANNTYTGGTTVTGGLITFSTAANLGTGAITLNGGGLQWASGNTLDISSRLAPLGLGGGTFDTNGNNITLASAIGGGTLVKQGAGTLTLTGANTYGGGTVVSGGILQGNSTSLRGNILNNANVVFDQVSDGTYFDYISGTGTLTKNAAGTLVLTGINTYSGGTIVNSGKLQGDTMSLQGNILNNASVVFALNGNQGVHAGNISGTGAIEATGSGNLTLTGTNTYTGGTTTNILLQGTSRSIQGNVLNNNKVVFDQAFDGAYAGNMSGSGQVFKFGTGKLTLSGDNTYSAGTTVTAGTLQGTTRSLSGHITNDAALIFDQGFDGIYAADIFGSGTLTKNGIGKVTLTGDNSVGGGTTVNAGGLSVTGELYSNVTVNKGGTLYGSGDVSGHITNNGGTIKPGNSIGHLSVNGNFIFNAGTYEVEVNARGDSDRIGVVGADHRVSINAGTLLIVPEAGTYVPNSTYTIITTEAGGTVLFDEVTGGVGFLTPKVSLDRNHVYVTLALAPNAFRSAGQTANQQAVGGALDAIAAGGSLSGLVTSMANVPIAQGPAALQALSGQPYADFGTLNTRSGQLFMNTVGRQMAVDRGSVGGVRSVALGQACEVACDASAPRFGGWLSAIGSTGNVAGDANAAGLTYSFGGAAFGIDYRVDPRFLVGIAGGYLSGTQWVSGFSGTGYSDNFNVALYASFTQGGFYADALAGYANASNRMQRVVNVPSLPTGIVNGSIGANQFLGQVEAGYRIGLGLPANASISPFARLQVGAVSQAGFTETGGNPYNLTVASQNTTSVRSTLGVDVAAGFDLGGGTPLEIGLRLGWLHEYADTSRPMTAAFAAAPVGQFTVYGATPQRDSAVVGLSVTAAMSDKLSLFLNYDGELGGGTDNHALRAGLRFTW